MQLTDPLDSIKGIGDKTKELYSKLKVDSVGALLTFYPRKYDRFTDPIDISKVVAGENVVICGTVSKVTESGYKSAKKILQCRVSDTSGEIDLIWFNQPYIKYELHGGYHFIFRGKVAVNGKKLRMEQAKIYRREVYEPLKSVLQPVYPLTAGLKNTAVTKAMKEALKVASDFPEYIPAAIRKEFGLIKKNAALNEMHFPKSYETLMEARRSLVFEEFFLFRVFLRAQSFGREVKKSDNVISDRASSDRLLESLPYSLTKGQTEAYESIVNDFKSGHIMARLIQGDVGSGKTIVAALALLMTVKNGYQGAMMVPTEVLANQHLESLSKLLEPFGVNCCLLTGSLTASEKKKVYEKIRSGEAGIVIGTHALFQEKVEFKNLALCITDEQHRFGVKQREGLSQKGSMPHILVMSATPIPRTLAMMLYGDMDISLIKELPKNRLPIKNCVVGPEYRETAYKFMEKQVAEGRQCYVICPMVDENEGADMKNVADYTEMLRERFGNKPVVGMLHGKMKPKEKNTIMQDFSDGKIDILVSTTVVEVGVNVPNATVMMVEDAERFGLAQLHQLRGRVGRGDKQSYCIFVTESESLEAKERLDILVKSNDGFFVAGEDLRLRGPGDIFGIRQCGDMYFKIGDIYNDAELLSNASEAVDGMEEKKVTEILEKMYESGAKEVFQFLNNYVTI